MDSVVVKNITKHYTINAGLLKQFTGRSGVVQAVSDVSFSIDEKEIVGLVGESGCGKTTLGKMLVKLEKATNGSIQLNGKDITHISNSMMRAFRRDIQIIFQDPYDSLDPKMTVYDIVAEPLQYLRLTNDKSETERRVKEILEEVELTPVDQYIRRYPHRLSGGQRQRVAIARALVVRPRFVVADEPVSMLDVSIRAGILNLLQKLNQLEGIGILLITHDLATARFLCNRIIVMYLGKIVEISKPQELVDNPNHPYSQLLLSSAPDLFADASEKVAIRGEIASAMAPPEGCRFWPRCPKATEYCTQHSPELRQINTEHVVACHHV